jgi:hypothetical protein
LAFLGDLGGSIVFFPRQIPYFTTNHSPFAMSNWSMVVELYPQLAAILGEDGDFAALKTAYSSPIGVSISISRTRI